MVCLNKLNAEFPKIDRLSVLYDFSLYGLQKIMLFELMLDQCDRKSCRIDRNIQFF